MRAGPTDAWAISKRDANDVIVSGLEPGQSILAAATVRVGHRHSRDLLKNGAAQDHPPLVERCAANAGLREYAVERRSNRCSGQCSSSIRFDQIATGDLKAGRYPWGPNYRKLGISLNDGSIRRQQATNSVRRATMRWEMPRDRQA